MRCLRWRISGGLLFSCGGRNPPYSHVRSEEAQARKSPGKMKGETKNLLTIVLTIAATGLAVIGVVVTLHVSVISQVANVQEGLAEVRERLARIETRLEDTLIKSTSISASRSCVQDIALASLKSAVNAADSGHGVREAPFGRLRGVRWLCHSSLHGACHAASSFLASPPLASL